jgi:carboxyl-terminal processing protease
MIWHSFFFVFTATGAEVSPDDEILENISLLAEVLARIEQEHLENPKPKDLMEGAIRGMLRTLDPYSQFFDRKSFTAFRTETGGTYGGLGMEIGIRRNRLTVISPFKGTPADEAGLKTGDIIS